MIQGHPSEPPGIRSWRSRFRARRRYGTMNRKPFYALAGDHLPRDRDATVVDAGCGDGSFPQQLGLAARYPNLWLLDGNPGTVANLKGRYAQVAEYRAPDPLPFPPMSVHFLHSSHMVEHLSPRDLYAFLRQIDRVLRPGGVLAISTPLLWEGFYADLSHVRPYNPEVFYNYLSTGAPNRSAATVSRRYSILALAFREHPVPIGTRLGALNPALDLLLQVARSALYRLGVRHYVLNGYSIVLRKSDAPGEVSFGIDSPGQTLSSFY